MAETPRNALCPCGSGKKYKHCCGKKEAVSISSLIDRELIECMNDMRQFVLQRYEREAEELLDQFPLDEMPEELELGVHIMAVNWMLFCWPLDEAGQTIFSAYRKSRHWERWRPSVQAHIERWEGAVPSLGEFIGYDDDNRPVVRDLLTGEEKIVHLLASDQWPSVIETGDVVFGFLVPYQDVFTCFTAMFSLPASGKDRLLRAIQQEGEWSGQPSALWMRDRFVAVLSVVLLEWLWQFAKQFKWMIRNKRPSFASSMKTSRRRQRRCSIKRSPYGRSIAEKHPASLIRSPSTRRRSAMWLGI
ncbi:hypothetical protein LR69_01418 [Geobacillus sp. BCO2]|nr:hypothetical protein LR69_01418 [Geobacillus sp. BCO2]